MDRAKPIFIHSVMIKKIPSLAVIGSTYLNDYPEPDYTLFREPLVETGDYTIIDTVIYENNIPSAYGRWYRFEDNGLNKNLVYDDMHSGRYHFHLRGLKYLSNISDLWYMNAILVGYDSKTTNPVQSKKASGVSMQSFANINLGVDAMYIATDSIKPAGTSVEEGLFDSSEVGIRLVVFVDKLDIIERVIGAKKVNNLQFHFTIKAYLIDPSLGGQYKDFTQTALLGQKSFYYEQTIPTYRRGDFSSKSSLKTGWGHFIYPVTTSDSTAITYIQLSDALKTIYNAMVFSQSTDNTSLRVDSSALMAWLNTDINLRNASDVYAPSSVTPTSTKPAFTFTEKDVLKNWLSSMKNEASVRGSSTTRYIMSYDNIYWEPLSDLYQGDIYSNSPALFMTRLTTYYENTQQQSPVDEPGNFEPIGGFVKSRRKYFLSNLVQYVLKLSPIDTSSVSSYIDTENPERFLGPKFFPFYRFRQYKDTPSGKELLDLITVQFSNPSSTENIIECETSTDLKKVVHDNVNMYRRKIITKPWLLPGSLGYSTTDRINSIGYVEYVNNDSSIEVIQLNLSAAVSKTNVFSFLTWIFLNATVLGTPAEWTRNGRYFTSARDLDTIEFLGYAVNPWKRTDLCTIMQSGMYDTPEIAYKEYKRIVEKIFIVTDPSPTDPAWKDFYKCIPNVERVEEEIEYCDPSPSPDGRRIPRRVVKQRYQISASGAKTPIGLPTYDYISTTVVLKDQTQIINGSEIKGDLITVYHDCGEFSERFVPYSGPTGPGVSTGPTGGTKRDVDLSLEDFINPAIFKVNEIRLRPSPQPIPLMLEKTYYKILFDQDVVGASSSDYRIRLHPGKRGQVLILEINTIGTRYKGVELTNMDQLANNGIGQRVYVSTDVWGNGNGIPFRSVLFLAYDGKNWIEFLRRDIY